MVSYERVYIVESIQLIVNVEINFITEIYSKQITLFLVLCTRICIVYMEKRRERIARVDRVRKSKKCDFMRMCNIKECDEWKCVDD